MPAIAVTAELETLCQGFGSIEYLKHLPDYPTEKFCEVYLVKFHTIQSARFAKRKMDDRNFYGGTLYVVANFKFKFNILEQKNLISFHYHLDMFVMHLSLRH